MNRTHRHPRRLRMLAGLTGVFSYNRVARADQVALRLVPAGLHLFPADLPTGDGGAAGAGSGGPAPALTA